MFEDSLVESGGRLKTKRGATTIISFFLEFLFLGVLVLLPLIFTEALPTKQLMTLITAPPHRRHRHHRHRLRPGRGEEDPNRAGQRPAAYADGHSEKDSDD